MSTLSLVIGAATWNAHPNSSLNCKLLSPILKTPRIFQDTGFLTPSPFSGTCPGVSKSPDCGRHTGTPPTVLQTFWPSVMHCSGADLFQYRVVEPQMTVPRLPLQAHWTLTHSLTMMQTSLIHAQRQPESSQRKAKNTHSPSSAWNQPVSPLTMPRR